MLLAITKFRHLIAKKILYKVKEKILNFDQIKNNFNGIWTVIWWIIEYALGRIDKVEKFRKFVAPKYL